jgi:hypothetical protein
VKSTDMFYDALNGRLHVYDDNHDGEGMVYLQKVLTYFRQSWDRGSTCSWADWERV